VLLSQDVFAKPHLTIFWRGVSVNDFVSAKPVLAHRSYSHRGFSPVSGCCRTKRETVWNGFHFYANATRRAKAAAW